MMARISIRNRQLYHWLPAVLLASLLSPMAFARQPTELETEQAALASYNVKFSECMQPVALASKIIDDMTRTFSPQEMRAWVQTPNGSTKITNFNISLDKSHDCLKPVQAEIDKTMAPLSQQQIIEDLSYQGFVVAEHVNAKDIAFSGCSAVADGLSIALADGRTFMCDAQLPSSIYNPTKPLSQPPVIVLHRMNTMIDVLLVDKIVYEGLFRPK